MRIAQLVASTALGAALVAAIPASAQEAAGAAPDATDEQGLQEIIVTAQRREESLQRAAVPVSAVTGDQLVNAGVSDTNGLSRLVPSLTVQPSGGQTSFVLRGVGTLSGNSFAENAIAFNYNGVFIGRPTAPVGTFYDLQRVEVVKGPQGTLYGRNATGGAINVLPNAPRLGEFSGNVTLEYGNYNNKKGQGAINIPLGDTMALRLAAQIVDRDGYLSDGYDDEVGQAFRASLLLKPSSDWSATFVTDYYHQGGKGGGHVLIPTSTFAAPSFDRLIGGADPVAIAAIKTFASTIFAPPFCGGVGNFVNSGCIMVPSTDGYQDNKFWGVAATIQGDMGFATLTIVPAYRRTEADYRNYLPGFLAQVSDNGDQMSLEARISSNGNGRLTYVLGGFLFYEQQDSLNFFKQGNLSTTRFNPRLRTESKAVFGQLTYEMVDGFRLVAGGRYTSEDKTQITSVAAGGLPAVIEPPLGAPFAGALSFNKFTWKGGVEWDVGLRSLLYANVATGFKTGGFFVAAPPANTFAPENLTAYTVGSKNRFFDNKLQLNVEAFYWDYVDQQITFVGGIRSGSGLVTQGGTTVNAGKSRIYGAEAEISFAPTRNDLLSANIQYLNGKYNSLKIAAFSNTGAPLPTGCTVTGTRQANPGVNGALFYDTDCSGKPTINSPTWSANLGYQHTFELGGDMKLVANAQTQIQSSQYFNVNYVAAERQDAFMTSDLALTLEGPDRRWSLTGYVNNVEDRRIIARDGTRPILNFSVATLRAPRTFGARGTIRF